jgi:hypothetical protein
LAGGFCFGGPSACACGNDLPVASHAHKGHLKGRERVGGGGGGGEDV